MEAIVELEDALVLHALRLATVSPPSGDDAETASTAKAERVLRDGAPLADEYPLVFRAGFPGRVLSLGDEAGPRSACAIGLQFAVMCCM